MQDTNKPISVTVQPTQQAQAIQPKKKVRFQMREKKPDIFVILLSIIISLIIVGFIIQLAWNESMPHIFGAKPIDFWPAICLFILTSILFK
jgi:hypothetical protein